MTLINDVKPCYDESKVNEIMRGFQRIPFILEGRQSELEEMMNQLYKDLSPTEINPLIVEGHCDRCP